MGDDTPTPARARTDRPVTDHLRQAFAQVTNPPIDAERERTVVDCRVELGPRDSMFAGPRSRSDARRLWLERPFVVDLDGLLDRASNTRRLDATWAASAGPEGLEAALDRLVAQALAAARRRSGLLVITDIGMTIDRLPIPSVLAVGAVHAGLTAAGLRGRTDILLDAADVLDVHAAAMAIAAGAGAVHPRLAIELAAEIAGSRGAEELTADGAVARLIDAFEAGLRKTLARMGICTVASYVGGNQFETLELSEAVVGACFPPPPHGPADWGSSSSPRVSSTAPRRPATYRPRRRRGAFSIQVAHAFGRTASRIGTRRPSSSSCNGSPTPRPRPRRRDRCRRSGEGSPPRFATPSATAAAGRSRSSRSSPRTASSPASWPRP